jgi:cyanophycinase-like exopeptidase
MTRAGPLSWHTGDGWIALVGSGLRDGTARDEIDAAILGWGIPGRPSVGVVMAGADAEESLAALEGWAELGGPTGYTVDLPAARDAWLSENAALLSEAGLVYLADGPSALALVGILAGTPALEALRYAFVHGAPIVAVGAASEALGAWVADPSRPGAAEPGLAWLPHAIVDSSFSGAESAGRLRPLLARHVDCLGVGIPTGSALALGPDGRVENLGLGQVTIVVTHERDC